MFILHEIADTFAGLFLVNCIPHLAAGLRGESFPSPFAKPPGKGLSSAPVNVLWGSFNLLVGIILLSRNPVVPGLHLDFILLCAAFVILGVLLSRHFASVRK
jgi:hypothetical protein